MKLPVDGDRGLVEKRTYKPCLKNIRKGDVFFYENGKRIDAEFDDAGESLDIIPENADANAEYMVEITCEDDRTRYRNARLLYNLMRFEGKNRPKNVWYKELVISSEEECRRMINERKVLTRNQKKRLNEAW